MTDALSTRPEAYAAFSQPTHIIWGEEDTVTPLSQAVEIDGLIPNSELTILSEIGHIPHIEDPETLNSALIEALSKISQRSE